MLVTIYNEQNWKRESFFFGAFVMSHKLFGNPDSATLPRLLMNTLRHYAGMSQPMRATKVVVFAADGSPVLQGANTGVTKCVQES